MGDLLAKFNLAQLVGLMVFSFKDLAKTKMFADIGKMVKWLLVHKKIIAGLAQG